MNCDECYKLFHRLRGRRVCKGNLKTKQYSPSVPILLRALHSKTTGCKYFIPTGTLLTWNERDYQTEGATKSPGAQRRVVGRVGSLALT